MNKLLTLLLVLCLAAPAFGGMSQRLDSLRIKTFRQLNLPDTGNSRVTTAVGNDAVNQAITWICAVAPAIERMDTVWVTERATSAPMNADFNRVATAELLWDDLTSPGVTDTARYPLYPLPDDSLVSFLPASDDVQLTRLKDPYTWRYYRTFGEYFLLYPAWNRSDSMRVIVQYYADDSVLTTDASETSVKNRYLDAVVDYACAKISMRRNNLQDAMVWENRARAYLGMPPLTREDVREK